MNKKFLSIAIVGFMLLGVSQKSLGTHYGVMKDGSVKEPVTVEVFYTHLTRFSSCPKASIILDESFVLKQFEVPLTCSIDHLTVKGAAYQLAGSFLNKQIKQQLKKGVSASNNFKVELNSEKTAYIISLLSFQD